MAKSDNMLAILWLLRSRGRVTAPRLAGELETSVRTIYRYIDSLCASGVPILADTGPEGGYELPPSFRSAPLFFAAPELWALFQAASFAREAGHPYTGHLAAALAKVRHQLTPAQARELDQHTAAFAVAGLQRGGPATLWGGPLETAAAEGAQLEIRYQKPAESTGAWRRIDPYVVFYRGGRWYVLAYCHTRQERREFRVDRVQDLRPTGEHFVRPADFRAEEYLAETWVEQQVQAGPHIPLRIAALPGVLVALCEHWYLKHCLVERTAGEALFHIDPTGLEHTPGYLLTFGTALIVREPASLRATMAEMARSILVHHEEGDPRGPA